MRHRGDPAHAGRQSAQRVAIFMIQGGAGRLLESGLGSAADLLLPHTLKRSFQLSSSLGIQFLDPSIYFITTAVGSLHRHHPDLRDLAGAVVLATRCRSWRAARIAGRCVRYD